MHEFESCARKIRINLDNNLQFQQKVRDLRQFSLVPPILPDIAPDQATASHEAVRGFLAILCCCCVCLGTELINGEVLDLRLKAGSGLFQTSNFSRVECN